MRDVEPTPVISAPHLLNCPIWEQRFAPENAARTGRFRGAATFTSTFEVGVLVKPEYFAIDAKPYAIHPKH